MWTVVSDDPVACLFVNFLSVFHVSDFLFIRQMGDYYIAAVTFFTIYSVADRDC